MSVLSGDVSDAGRVTFASTNPVDVALLRPRPAEHSANHDAVCAIACVTARSTRSRQLFHQVAAC